MRILIVEDDVASCFVLKKFVEPMGEVHVAGDGESALEKFMDALEKNSPFHLIFLDIMLPKLDGQDVLKKIRMLERDQGKKPVDAVKVVMMTALSDPNNVLQAFNERHADSYLVKPIEYVKLIQELNKIGIAVE